MEESATRIIKMQVPCVVCGEFLTVDYIKSDYHPAPSYGLHKMCAKYSSRSEP